MGFVKVFPAPKSMCYCKKPDSRGGKYFGKGTIWRCDICGAAWKYEKNESSQRDGDWDVWSRSETHDGPDNRPTPEPPKVDDDSPPLRRDRGCFR